MTDFQTARVALGTRLRELRIEGGLLGKELAERCRWQASKVSRIETGKQTPTVTDLRTWTSALDRDDTFEELKSRLRTLETHYASWRRQLGAGTKASQEAWQVTEAAADHVRAFEAAVIPGLLQTAEYARHMLTRTTSLHGTVPDIDAGVNARLQRQQVLYEPRRRFEFLLWEPALHMLICPREVMAGQLDRLSGLVGMPTVTLGIVPLGGTLRVVPTHGFWIFDRRLVMVETIGAELRLDEDSEVELYTTVWNELAEAAVYSSHAHRLIARARASLDSG